jgi:hypothetical protein
MSRDDSRRGALTVIGPRLTYGTRGRIEEARACEAAGRQVIGRRLYPQAVNLSTRRPGSRADWLGSLSECHGALKPLPTSLPCFGPTSMRKPLSRPERDDCGTSQTSIRRHLRWRSAMRVYAVAPIQYRGVAMRHVGPRDATWVPLSISTWTASSPLCLCAPDRLLSGDLPIDNTMIIILDEHLYGRNRERLAGDAGGGDECPCSPARRRRHPNRMLTEASFIVSHRRAQGGSPMRRSM